MSDYCTSFIDLGKRCENLDDSSKNNCSVCTTFFIKMGHNPNQGFGKYYPDYPLINSVFHRDGDVLDILLEYENIDLNVAKHGITALGYASAESSLDNIVKLLNKGSNINGVSCFMLSPVFIALSAGRGTNFKFLLGYKPFIDYDVLLRYAKEILEKKEDKNTDKCYDIILNYK